MGLLFFFLILVLVFIHSFQAKIGPAVPHSAAIAHRSYYPWPRKHSVVPCKHSVARASEDWLGKHCATPDPHSGRLRSWHPREFALGRTSALALARFAL